MSLPKLCLGLDPGTVYLGYALVKTGEPSCRKIGAQKFQGRLHFRLCWLSEVVRDLLSEIATGDDRFEVAVEKAIVWGGNLATIALAEARGVILAEIARARRPLAEYHASQVKKAITGKGNAKKPELAAVVRRLLSIEEDLPLDATDAAALAYFHANRSDIFGGIE